MPTIEQVAESLAAWFEYYGPELMRRKLEKESRLNELSDQQTADPDKD